MAEAMVCDGVGHKEYSAPPCFLWSTHSRGCQLPSHGDTQAYVGSD